MNAKATQVYVLFSKIIFQGRRGKGFVYILTADYGCSDRTQFIRTIQNKSF